ncbi:MAG: MDR/zinc-dependent alcohol dehydrogenase-like family protein [Myxococcota bacterium]
MRGLWLQDGDLSLRDDLSPPPLSAGDAQVRVLTAGVCSTDLELVRGYMPFTGVPGHEFVGVVEEGPADWMGQRVVGEINAACGVCATCQAGRGNHCPSRTVVGIVNHHGAFAERMVLPSRNLHRVPNSVSTEAAAFTEPLAAALRIGEQVSATPGARVIVVGAGRLGQLIARTLAVTDCELSVVVRSDRGRALLANHGIHTATADALDTASADLVVEVTGNPAGFAIARRLVRPGGTLVMKSTYAGELTVNASMLVVDEITLVGSRCGPFKPALELLERGAIEVSDLIAARYPLSQGLEAFEVAGRPGALKVQVEMST